MLSRLRSGLSCLLAATLVATAVPGEALEGRATDELPRLPTIAAPRAPVEAANLGGIAPLTAQKAPAPPQASHEESAIAAVSPEERRQRTVTDASGLAAALSPNLPKEAAFVPAPARDFSLKRLASVATASSLVAFTGYRYATCIDRKILFRDLVRNHHYHMTWLDKVNVFWLNDFIAPLFVAALAYLIAVQAAVKTPVSRKNFFEAGWRATALAVIGSLAVEAQEGPVVLIPGTYHHFDPLDALLYLVAGGLGLLWFRYAWRPAAAADDVQRKDWAFNVMSMAAGAAWFLYQALPGPWAFYVCAALATVPPALLYWRSR